MVRCSRFRSARTGQQVLPFSISIYIEVSALGLETIRASRHVGVRRTPGRRVTPPEHSVWWPWQHWPIRSVGQPLLRLQPSLEGGEAALGSWTYASSRSPLGRMGSTFMMTEASGRDISRDAHLRSTKIRTLARSPAVTPAGPHSIGTQKVILVAVHSGLCALRN